MILIVFVGLLIALLLVGISIPFAIGGTSLIVILMERGFDVVQFGGIANRMVAGVNQFTLLAIPFFLFAGKLMNRGSIAKRIFTFANYIVGWIPGGLAHANIFASLIHAGQSGSAVSDVVALGPIQIKAMRRAGFRTDFAAACSATSAIISPVTPPSIPLVVFGVVGSVSINRLFMGGVVPGLLITFVLMLTVIILSSRRNYPRTFFPGWKTFIKAGLDAFFPSFTVVILVGGIIAGVFTATEAAAVASLYAFILTFFVYREVSLRDVFEVVKEALRETAAIMMIVAAASIYGFLITRTQLPQTIMAGMLTITENPVMILVLLNIFLLTFGLFMEPNSAIIILTPVLMPIVGHFGIDPVHFGVVMVFNLMIGLLTPPVGMLLFVTGRIAKLPYEKLLKSIVPFYIPLVILLFFVTFVPQTVLWLPNLIFG